ncbi:MAG: sigma-54-dependent Fis family transcriptional regulator [Desulfosarcina sp.]|nr:sigma-54-dependent Fis family transcriptional regulator [Desulfobacterales bacterium]
MESIPSNETPILVVDDDVGLLTSIHAVLVGAGFPEPALLSQGRKTLETIEQGNFRLVLLDLMMPDADGMELLRAIKSHRPHLECIVFTAVDDVETAIQAVRFGAYDYLVKGQNNEKLVITINRALERFALRQERRLRASRPSFAALKHPQAFRNFIAVDPSMALVFRQVEAVAPTDYSVVITGESGTGKEMLARTLHRLSNRSEAPFIAVNMAAFSRGLFEDEFFGHIRGAYPHAVSAKKGFLEEAQEGTLFLDEITELDHSLQGKLLRVIEEKELYRLGSTQLRNIDVRFIAATNRDIRREIEQGRFRADLFYRLNTCNLPLPPLRERRQDIIPLAEHFTQTHAARMGKPIRGLAPELEERLAQYEFPGNIRELQNIIATAVLVEETDQLLPASVQAALPEPAESLNVHRDKLLSLAEIERRHIHRVLRACEGDRTKAAEILGVNPSTVYRKIKRLGI